MRLILLVLPGVLDGALGVTLDVAHTANRLLRDAGKRELFEVQTVAPLGRTQSTAAGLRVGPMASLPSIGKGDLVVVPGGDAATDAEIAQWLVLPALKRAAHWLGSATAAGAHVAVNCNSVFLAAEAGLLDNKCATTSWWLAPLFRKRYPTVTLDLQHMVVPDGTVTTAGAAFAQADLMLAMVTRFGSVRLAAQCSRVLLIDQRESQSRYSMLRQLARQDPFLARLERWLESRLSQKITTAELAAAMHVSSRTLTRRVQAAVGLAPIRLMQRMRVERALYLLETSKLPLATIASQVGYADAATLRRLLLRDTGASPKALRSRAGVL